MFFISPQWNWTVTCALSIIVLKTFYHWIYSQALDHPPMWSPWPSTYVTPPAQYLNLKYAASQVCHGWLNAKPWISSGTTWRRSGEDAGLHLMKSSRACVTQPLLRCPDVFYHESTREPPPNRCLYQSFLAYAQTFGGSPVCSELFTFFDIFSYSSFSPH